MGSCFKEKDRWRIQWLDGEGRRRSKRFKSKKLAEHALRIAEIEAEEVSVGLRKPRSVSKTFNELADHWEAVRVPEKRSGKDDISLNRRHLRPWFGNLPVEKITPAVVDRFALSLEGSPKTRHNTLTHLIAMLNEAKRQGWLSEVPRIRKPKLNDASRDFRFLKTPEEINRFLKAAEPEGPIVYLMYLTALVTGMRAGELAALEWSDLDFENRLIVVRRSFDGPTKASYVRHVPMLDPLPDLLADWRKKNPLDHLFPNRNGTMHTKSARIFQETLHRVLDRGKFPKEPRRKGYRYYMRFHDLRHGFASHWVMNGGDLYKLQKIGGWKSFAMVQRYAHLAPDAFKNDYDRLSAALGADCPNTPGPSLPPALTGGTTAKKVIDLQSRRKLKSMKKAEEREGPCGGSRDERAE